MSGQTGKAIDSLASPTQTLRKAFVQMAWDVFRKLEEAVGWEQWEGVCELVSLAFAAKAPEHTTSGPPES